MSYEITTQRQLRKFFWKKHPKLDRRKIKDYSGNGTMYRTDIRTAFVDFIDMLSKADKISESLANKAEL